MNLLMRIAILVFSLLIVILIALPFALDRNSLRFQIEQEISKRYNSSFEINGDLQIALFPLPKIVVNDAVFNNLRYMDVPAKLQIKALSIRVAIFSLFSDHTEISKLVFDSPTLTIGEFSASANKGAGQNKAVAAIVTPTKNGLTSKIFKFKSEGEVNYTIADIDKIKVVNGRIFKYNDDHQLTLNFNSLNFEIDSHLKEQRFVVQGNFITEEIPTEFEMTINTNKNEDSRLVVSSSILTMELSGQFTNSDIFDLKKSSFAGKFKTEIIDLKTVVNKYFSKNSLFSKKIKSTKPIKISAEVDGKKGEMKIHNIIINSEIINGSGLIEANFSLARPVLDIDLIINNVNVDGMWFGDSANEEDDPISKTMNIVDVAAIKEPVKNVPLPAVKNSELDSKKKKNGDEATKNLVNLDLTAEIKIKNAQYLGQELKDVDVYLILSGTGNILLQPLTAKIPGNGFLRISGAFENENNIPKFVGVVDVTGSNLEKFLEWIQFKPDNLRPDKLGVYHWSSNVLVLPAFITLGKLYGSINNGKNIIFGEIKFDETTGLYNVVADLRINNLQVEDYFVVADKNKYFVDGVMTNKLLWLNTITSHYDITLFFDRLSYLDNVFANQNVHFQFGQGYLTLAKTTFHSDKNNITTALNINISNRQPYLELLLDADHLRIGQVADNTVETSENAENNPEDNQEKSVDTEKSIDKNKQNPPVAFVEQFFRMPSFVNMNGKINIDVRDVQLDSLQLRNLKISGGVNNGEITFNDAKCNIFGGSVKFRGLLSLKSSKLINGSFELLEADNKQLLSNLLAMENINGISNISGIISVSANNKAEFLTNLETQLQFLTANVVVEGFGIDDLAVKTLSPQENIAELNKPDLILFNPRNKTFIKDAKGTLDIRRNNRKNELAIETKSIGINGVTKAAVNFGGQTINGLSNFVFISGTKSQPIPINIAVSYKGKSGDLDKDSDTKQVKQYLQMMNK